MSRRPIKSLRPGLESLEAKHLLSAGAVAAPPAHAQADSAEVAPVPVHPPHAAHTHARRVVGTPAAANSAHPKLHVQHRHNVKDKANADPTVSAQAVKPNFGYLVYRTTNPNNFNNHIQPPFGHVLIQRRQPKPGRVYNILQLTVRNGTAQTFDASSNFSVKFPGQHYSTPILTGDQTWKSGQNFIFYVVTTKYYALNNQVTEGFIFNLGGARSVAFPGPSGIFLRVKYNPNTINKLLDKIVTKGVGAQGGKGIKFGIPDTAIDEFVSARTRRNDFGGYF